MFPQPFMFPTRQRVQTLVSQSDGTNIGDMTSPAIANHWDNNTSTTSGALGASAFSGKDYGSGVTKYPSGFIVKSGAALTYSGNNGGTCTIAMYGSNSSPANSTDGTLLYGPVALTNAAGNTTTVTSGVTNTTAYRYLWLTITATAGEMHFAEVQFYEDI